MSHTQALVPLHALCDSLPASHFGGQIPSSNTLQPCQNHSGVYIVTISISAHHYAGYTTGQHVELGRHGYEILGLGTDTLGG